MTQAQVVRFDHYGDPSVLKLETIDLSEPSPGEVRLRQTAIGFNYIDTYHRTGLYPVAAFPSGLGYEAAGVVEAIGRDVLDIAVGDRVAYVGAGLGAYADLRNVSADKLVVLPGDISDVAAAALIFKGLTAQYLLKKTYPVQPGDRVLIHAAAGGVGQILSRWAKALGAFVVGTAGGPQKCAVALASGCDVAIDYREAGWTERVLAAFGGQKARVVYDSVGKDTFLHSLDLTEPFGYVVSFGNASGPAPAIAPDILNKKGCLYLTRPSLAPHLPNAAVLRAQAADLFDAARKGWAKVEIGAEMPLGDCVAAHQTAERRQIAGALILRP